MDGASGARARFIARSDEDAGTDAAGSAWKRR
jgi:hypothetical protein